MQVLHPCKWVWSQHHPSNLWQRFICRYRHKVSHWGISSCNQKGVFSYLCISQILRGTPATLGLYGTCSSSSRETTCIFFFFLRLRTKMKSNYFLWALSSGTSLSCSERHSRCSRVFASPICFLIFSPSLSLSPTPTARNYRLSPGTCPTDSTDQITNSPRRCAAPCSAGKGKEHLKGKDAIF